MKSKLTKRLGFAALIVGLTLCGIGLRLLLSPAQYQASVRVRFGPEEPGFGDPYFIQPELEAPKSDMVLSNVVKKLNLYSDWGGNITLKYNQAISRLKHRTTVQEVQGIAYILEIRVIDSEPAEAARIANAIAETYCAAQNERIRQLILGAIKVLKDEYQKEENDIKTKRTNLEQLRMQQNVTNPEPADAVMESNYPSYFRARRELTNEMATHTLLNGKIESETSIANKELDYEELTRSIVNLAVPPTMPIGPNRQLGAILLICGLAAFGVRFYLISCGSASANSKS